MNIAFFGSSLVSAYWNGAATYYRGIVRALHERGHRVRFYEPDAYGRQQHRDIADPDWAEVIVYPGEGDEHALRMVEHARGADLVVKASGVGVFDNLLEAAVLQLQGPGTRVAFWDVDAPATLDRMRDDPADRFRALVPRYDLVLTYGGGDPVVRAYEGFGARLCVPIYNALDPTTHHPVARDPRFDADLGFSATGSPIAKPGSRRSSFARPRSCPPAASCSAGAAGRTSRCRRTSDYVGHVYTADHNAFNVTPKAVLNVSRESMARYGFSPATRVFEARARPRAW
jgi:spore maturation protein CgeB